MKTNKTGKSYSFKHLFERLIYRTEIFFFSHWFTPNGCNSWSWAYLQLAAKTSSRPPTWEQGPSSLLPSQYFSGELD